MFFGYDTSFGRHPGASLESGIKGLVSYSCKVPVYIRASVAFDLARPASTFGTAGVLHPRFKVVRKGFCGRQEIAPLAISFPILGEGSLNGMNQAEGFWEGGQEPNNGITPQDISLPSVLMTAHTQKSVERPCVVCL